MPQKVKRLLSLETHDDDYLIDRLTTFVNKASYGIIIIGICLLILGPILSVDTLYIQIGAAIALIFLPIPIINYLGYSLYANAYLLTMGSLWQAVTTLYIGGDIGQEAIAIGNIFITAIVFYHHKRMLTFLIIWNALMYLLPKVYMVYNEPIMPGMDYIFDEILVTFATMTWAIMVLFIYVRRYNYILSSNKTQIQTISERKTEVEMFTKLVAHDLRSPLRHANSFLKLAEKSLENGDITKTKEYLSNALTGTSQIKHLVEDISLMSNLKEKNDYHIGHTNVAKTVASMIEREKSANPDIIIEYTHGELPVVSGDIKELEIVFAELIHNAIKYNRRSPIKLTIWGQKRAESYHLYVQDNGIGVPGKYSGIIFNYFEKLHSHDKYSGTGLGLTIVKKIINRHDGDIQLMESSEQGSTFEITLPMSIIVGVEPSSPPVSQKLQDVPVDQRYSLS